MSTDNTPAYQKNGITLYLGDSAEIMPTLEPQSIDCILTDPPYELSIAGGNKGCFHKSYHKLTSEALGEMSHGFDIPTTFEQFARLQNKVSIFCFCSNRQISRLMIEGEQRDWITTLLVWHKYNSVPFCHGTWRPDAEFVVHYRKGGPINGGAKLKNKVKRCPFVQSKIHPTQKPLEILSDYIQVGSNPGDVVFDPYMGSGSTIVAAAKLGRRAIGIEKHTQYFSEAVKRIESETLI